MDKMMRQVDPSLLEAMQLVERKFTRLTLVAAMGVSPSCVFVPCL